MESMANKMNHKLTKKLKNAGFPQKQIEAGDFVLFENETKVWSDKLGIVSETDGIREPSLSELIEACGEKFLQIVYNHNPRATERWEVTGQQSEKVKWVSFGKTPSEAVANLWLALNK